MVIGRRVPAAWRPSSTYTALPHHLAIIRSFSRADAAPLVAALACDVAAGEEGTAVRRCGLRSCCRLPFDRGCSTWRAQKTEREHISVHHGDAERQTGMQSIQAHCSQLRTIPSVTSSRFFAADAGVVGGCAGAAAAAAAALGEPLSPAGAASEAAASAGGAAAASAAGGVAGPAAARGAAGSAAAGRIPLTRFAARPATTGAGAAAAAFAFACVGDSS